MTTDLDDTEQRIARYTAELRAEASLAEGDLAELEDHLRCVTAELRERGLPATAAVTEAARRLGDPKELAREHARASSPFGARLPKARAWSAALLLAPFALYYGAVALRHYPSVPMLLETALGVGLVVALALRLTWARAFLVGSLVDVVVHNIPYGLTLGFDRMQLAQLVAYAGAFAFLAPHRRRELTGAGLGLALMGIAYGGAATLIGLQLTNSLGAPFGGWLAVFALGAVLLGALGGMLRARWGAVLTLASGLALAVGASWLWDLTIRVPHGEVIRVTILGSLLVGAAAATAAGILGWRAARRRSAPCAA